MYACLYWIDENDFPHVMRGEAADLVDDTLELDSIGYPWKLETFDYLVEMGDDA